MQLKADPKKSKHFLNLCLDCLTKHQSGPKEKYFPSILILVEYYLHKCYYTLGNHNLACYYSSKCYETAVCEELKLG